MEENLSDVTNFVDGASLPGGNNDNAKNDGNTSADAEKAKQDEVVKKATEAKALEDKTKADKEAAEKAASGTSGGASDTLPEAVEIEGIKYKLDDKGNALDDKGAIFKTKEQLDELEAIDEPVVDIIIKKAGFELKGDDGKPLLFEDTEEGIIQAALAIGKASAIKEREDLIKSDPEFEEFIEHKKRGGSLRDFAEKKTNSFSNIKLDENNEGQLMNIIMTDLLATGMSEDQAKITADMYKDTKRLKEFGKAAFERLVKNEKEVEEAEKKAFETRQKDYTEQVQNHWKSVKEVVNKGALNNLVIPEADKEAFYKYIAMRADDKGRSQRDLDMSKLPLERSLQLDYFLFKGFDLSKLITNAASTQRARTLRDKLKEKTGVGGGAGINKDNYQKPNDLNISIDNLIT